jgi:metallo-beta-lactamase family protein
MTNQVTIKFLGGAESVTGSNFLISDGEKNILIDCGLFQGTKVSEDNNREKFDFDPTKIDVLFVTHAHLDHIGRIPKLVKDGFTGVIYSTPPTKDISAVSLIDSMGVMEKEARGDNVPPLYDQDDVRQAMGLWQTAKYHEPITVGKFQAVMRDSGHVLGSAMVEFTYNGKKIMFTGDLGNSPTPLLPDPEVITDIDYMVMESVYGDRNHEGRDERSQRLRTAIKETLANGGTVMIPAFSIERTQEFLFEIENMMENSEIPLVPVFLDSPLAIEVTAIYKKYQDYFNKDARQIMREGDGLFHFPQLHMTKSTDESKAIRYAGARKIILAGSGMSNGGRILHHEKLYLPDPNSSLVIAGYQASGSLGRVIQEGAKSIRILGEDVPVNGKVILITGYSGHKDGDGLVDFVSTTTKTLKQVFVAMGEPKSASFLAQRLHDTFGINATVPKQGDTITIDLT